MSNLPAIPQSARRKGDESGSPDTPAGGSLLSELRGGGDATEAPPPIKVKRGLPTQHIVTVLVILAGGGALVAMRQYGMDAGMKFDKSIKVDFVETSVVKRSPEQERILTDLQRGVSTAPPEPADIEKNPFLLAAGPAPAVETVADTSAEDEARRTADERRRRAQSVEMALGTVVLNSVMGGQTPMARVNGDIVRVGDKVAELFTVAAIQGRSILLTADGEVFIVEMSQESAPRPQPQIRPKSAGR